MKKVIDANYFQDPELLDYLKADKNNLVVLTEPAQMEAYKGNAIINISKSMEIISQFPDQLIVLKQTLDIVRLSHSPEEQNNFEDSELTKGFNDFCIGIKLALQGDSFYEKQILEKGRLASKHFDNLLKEAEGIALGIKLIGKSLGSDCLDILRKKEALPPEFAEKITKDVLFMSARLFKYSPGVNELPHASQQIPNTFIFRYALSCYLLALKWISDGGTEEVRPEKLRNDVIDMQYVPYATFYNGLLTNDKKMIQIYYETCYLLENLFFTEPNKFN